MTFDDRAPMAATVDKVFREHPTWKHEITTTKDRLDGAIRRAAENAGFEISRTTYRGDIVPVQEQLAQVIERHVRRELGL